jgi:hypothetical protein
MRPQCLCSQNKRFAIKKPLKTKNKSTPIQPPPPKKIKTSLIQSYAVRCEMASKRDAAQHVKTTQPTYSLRASFTEPQGKTHAVSANSSSSRCEVIMSSFRKSKIVLAGPP